MPAAKPGLSGSLVGPSSAGLPKPSLVAAPAKAPIAPVAPVAPAPPAQGQQPEFDQPYFDTIDSINRDDTRRRTSFDDDERRVKFDFGLDDPTNPFNRAEALKKSFLFRGRAASAGLASRGQLYSGSHERAMTKNRGDTEEASAALRQSYTDALNQIQRLKDDQTFTSEAARIKAYEDWLARRPAADVDVPPEAAPGAAPAAGPAPVALGGSAQPTSSRPASPRAAAEAQRTAAIKARDKDVAAARTKVSKKPRSKVKRKP